MTKDELVGAVKDIVGKTRGGDVDNAYLGYGALYAREGFTGLAPGDQRQALKLLIMAKRTGKQPPSLVDAHRAALMPLTELVSAHSDPEDYEMLGLCHLILGNEQAASNIFREALSLERARNPQSDPMRSLDDTHLRDLNAPGRLFVRIAEAVSAEQCAAWTAGVYEGRAAWVHDFEGEQASLGRAWYTHLEQDKTREYFAGAAASDATVERYCPGLQASMRDWMSRIIGAPVVQRRAFCGPGVHVFPAGNVCSREGGEVHYDRGGPHAGGAHEPSARAHPRAHAGDARIRRRAPRVGRALRRFGGTTRRRRNSRHATGALPSGHARGHRFLPAPPNRAVLRRARPHHCHLPRRPYAAWRLGTVVLTG